MSFKLYIFSYHPEQHSRKPGSAYANCQLAAALRNCAPARPAPSAAASKLLTEGSFTASFLHSLLRTVREKSEKYCTNRHAKIHVIHIPYPPFRVSRPPHPVSTRRYPLYVTLRSDRRARAAVLARKRPNRRSSHGARPSCRPVSALVDGLRLERLKHPTTGNPLLPVPNPVPRSMLLDGPHAKRSNTTRNVAGLEVLDARTRR